MLSCDFGKVGFELAAAVVEVIVIVEEPLRPLGSNLILTNLAEVSVVGPQPVFICI